MTGAKQMPSACNTPPLSAPSSYTTDGVGLTGWEAIDLVPTQTAVTVLWVWGSMSGEEGRGYAGYGWFNLRNGLLSYWRRRKTVKELMREEKREEQKGMGRIFHLLWLKGRKGRRRKGTERPITPPVYKRQHSWDKGKPPVRFHAYRLSFPPGILTGKTCNGIRCRTEYSVL